MAGIAAIFIALPLFLSAPTSQAAPQVIPGIEVLLSEQLNLIRGKRVGLITNHSGVNRQLRHDIDLLASAPGVKLTALFSPEHGIRGAAQAGEKVRSAIDAKTGVAIHSLYEETRRPTAQRRGRPALRHPGHWQPLLHLYFYLR